VIFVIGADPVGQSLFLGNIYKGALYCLAELFPIFLVHRSESIIENPLLSQFPVYG
jgi:hypothetical protein